MSRPFPRLFVTDLDGTALGGGYRPYSRLPDAFASFLDRLAARGCRWATCTTWELPAQLNLLYASAVQTPPAYVIGGSGLYLTAYQEEQLEKVQPYTGRMERMLEETVRVELHPLMKEIAARFDPVLTQFNGYWYSMTVRPEDTGRMLEVTGSLERRYPGLHIERIPAENRFFVHAAFMRKGTAVRELQRVAGLTPDEIVVAGDERMDLSMMEPEVAQYAVCPDNAQPAVKERVRANGGCIGEGTCSDGVIDAFTKLAAKHGWSF
ncbi:HAD family hydrolase [Paenibacillus koleovorans]|uniref:HAD family hydrolase n=1 Tax=Paenibacillus koleovorans TaxID=121608 RepID=UPI000FD9EDD7|nr:HAD hydrolase family protein [Paenibacillus koleovorans]